MSKPSRYVLTGILLISGLIGPGCGTDDAAASDSKFTYQNQIFRNTSLISAATNGQANQPALSWPATGQTHVVCAIFRERIEVKGKHIENGDQAVWLWHSGLGAGREGAVLYEDGIVPQTNAEPPEVLPQGRYYWAVWALDLAGDPVASSFEHTLEVP